MLVSHKIASTMLPEPCRDATSKGKTLDHIYALYTRCTSCYIPCWLTAIRPNRGQERNSSGFLCIPPDLTRIRPLCPVLTPLFSYASPSQTLPMGSQRTPRCALETLSFLPQRPEQRPETGAVFRNTREGFSQQQVAQRLDHTEKISFPLI